MTWLDLNIKRLCARYLLCPQPPRRLQPLAQANSRHLPPSLSPWPLWPAGTLRPDPGSSVSWLGASLPHRALGPCHLHGQGLQVAPPLP